MSRVIEDLRDAHAEAKAELSQARQQHGRDSDQAKNAKRKVDRLYQAIKRAEKRPPEPEPRSRARARPRKKPTPSGNPRAAQRTAEDFAPPHVLGVVAEPVEGKRIRVVDRQPKGNRIRVVRRNRETRTHVAIVDATLDRRFTSAKEYGRWVTLELESGEAAVHGTWEGACFYARIPSEWSTHSRKLANEG